MTNSIRRNSSRLYFGGGLLLVAAYFLAPPVRGNGLLFNLIGLSSAAAVATGLRLHRPTIRAPWYLFIAGQLLFVGGDAFYYGYTALSGRDVPFPSPADFLYLAVYPALVAGLVIIIRRRTTNGDSSGLLDALVITTGMALLSWVFLMAPYAHDDSLRLVEKLVSIAYPLMDVCLTAVAVRLAVAGGLRKPALALIVTACVTLFTTDSILGLLTLNGSGHTEGGLLDIGWALNYLLWGAAALHPSMRTLHEPVPDRAGRLSRRRLALLTTACLIAPGLQALQTLRGDPVDPPIIAASSAALFCLAMARMAGLLRASEKSAARERALREAGAALVSATGRAEVHQAALTAMLALVGPGHHARVCTILPTGELRAGDADGHDWALATADLLALDARHLREQRSLEVSLDTVDLRQALRLPADVSHMVVYPLFVQLDLRGLVFVAGPAITDASMRQTMQTLALNITLALESSVLTADLLLRQSAARFESLVQHSSDLITVITADTTIAYESPSVNRVLGYGSDGLTGHRFVELLHPQEREHVTAVLADSITSAHPQADVVECRLRHANGAWLLFEISRTNLLDDPNVEGIVLNARDISERKRFEEQLAHQAFHDPVTALANRALFTDRVQHALSRRGREAGSIGIVFVDLDDFKMVNDSLGHAAGDEVLAEVGRRLLGCVRPMDTVARFGGDEFAILLEHSEGDEQQAAIDVAVRVLAALDAPASIDGREVVCRASLGIASLSGTDTASYQAEDLLRNADVAMYMAKREGKGRFRVFEPAMHTDVLNRLETTGALQHSIDAGNFTLSYQPIIHLADERLHGFEALVRWNRPGYGEMSPGEFIPLAEETGLIVPLGDFVLEKACREAVFLQELVLAEPPLTISVNISVKQLQQPDFTSKLISILEDTGLEPSRLVLEITESLLMIDTGAAVQLLTDLKAVGVQLAVDDFGTGYSSLGYLSRFPVDILKIDRSFVMKLTDSDEASALAAAIVRLGETLNLRTVAEGVETRAQFERLLELGCQFGQGFLLGRPMSLDEALDVARSLQGPTAPAAPTAPTSAPG